MPTDWSNVSEPSEPRVMQIRGTRVKNNSPASSLRWTNRASHPSRFGWSS
ncbi:hypothetical protein [Novipirellula sp.]